MTKYIFVTGGVVSRLGKGHHGSVAGQAAQKPGTESHDSKIRSIYQCDPGTMSPYQHGEVFVTDDGAETDLDLGHYERFIDINLTKNSNVTTGQNLLLRHHKERRGEYLGRDRSGHSAYHE